MAYGFARSITIDHTKVAANQTLYPVLINSTLTYLRTVANGGDVQNASGFDIIFVTDPNDESSLLNWEVEKYTATSGLLIAWVKLPTLSASVDDVFYMLYGNAAISTFQGNVANTWATGFKGVWHMPGNELGVIPPDLTDSTSNNNDGTATGLSNQLTTAVQIDGGCSNTGGGTGIECGTGSSLEVDSFTASMWINPTGIGSFGSNRHLIAKSDDDGVSSGWSIILIGDGGHTTGTVRFTFKASAHEDVFSTITIANGVLINVAFVRDRVAGEFRIYIAGVLVDTIAITTNILQYLGDEQYIGGPGGGVAAPYAGLIDEVRIYNAVRSATWLLTEFRNQSSPSTFYTISAVSTPFTASCGSPPNGDVGTLYTHTFPQPVSGGAPPFFFALLTRDHEAHVPEDVLNNITLDPSTGVWSGYPAAPGTYEFTLDVVDTTSREAFADCTVIIGPTTSDDPWIPAPPIDPPFGWDFDGACARTGDRGVRHIADGTAEGGNARVASNTPVTVEAGWTLYLSFWAKSSGSADGSIGFGFMFYDEDGVFIGEEFVMTIDQYPTVFTEYTGSIVVPTGAVSAIPMIQVTDHLTGTWCIDDVYAIRQGGYFILSSIKHYFDQYTLYRQT